MEGARAAGAGDESAVTELARALRRTVAGERGGALWTLEARQEPLDRTLFEAPCVVVGTVDDVVVGYGVGGLTRLADGSTLAVVEELYVDPEAREIGVGEAILEELTAWASGSGAVAIDAVVLPGMRAGKNLFERAGMAARVLRPSKPLR